MSKKKKIVLVIAIISSILLAFVGGQSYAKYVSEVRGNGMAEVATWNFKVNGQKEEVQMIELGSTCDNETLVGNKIAPGTKGSFNIVVDGTGSDVGIFYQIEFRNENNKPTNLKFIYNDRQYSSITELQSSLSGTIYANAEDKVRTFNIQWEWPYITGVGTGIEEEQKNDKIDTQDAMNIATYSFDVIVSGTQVAPQA